MGTGKCISRLEEQVIDEVNATEGKQRYFFCLDECRAITILKLGIKTTKTM